jgi:hypothetical protein
MKFGFSNIFSNEHVAIKTADATHIYFCVAKVHLVMVKEAWATQHCA